MKTVARLPLSLFLSCRSRNPAGGNQEEGAFSHSLSMESDGRGKSGIFGVQINWLYEIKINTACKVILGRYLAEKNGLEVSGFKEILLISLILV